MCLKRIIFYCAIGLYAWTAQNGSLNAFNARQDYNATILLATTKKGSKRVDNATIALEVRGSVITSQHEGKFPNLKNKPKLVGAHGRSTKPGPQPPHHIH